MEKPELVGADIDFDFSEGNVVVKIKHVGAHGYANLECGAEALPTLNKLVDAIEKAIPGDQSTLAEMLKSAIAKIKI
jgi:hypothetical protein